MSSQSDIVKKKEAVVGFRLNTNIIDQRKHMLFFDPYLHCALLFSPLLTFYVTYGRRERGNDFEANAGGRNAAAVFVIYVSG